MHLSEGTTIGPYRIERELGRGGMGIVYLARDTRLDRMVAIKALPDHLTADPDRLARFEREAKIVASLHHPGIAGVYALEKNDSGAYLVMELVEGETLAMRLERGALPLGEAVRAAISIADALDAAHEKGVVHRDLKPGNIMVTPDGGLKILDFGLARSDETAAASTSAHLLSQSPTLSTPVHSPTIPGVIMGTAGYMSPEQARGKAVDKRSDIFSFGVVVYEMLTGIKPFHGETVADAIGATLHKDVELDRLPPSTPPGVRRILTRCLQRDKALRFRDIGDVRFELEHAGAPEDHTPGAAAKRPLLPIMLAAIALVLGAAGVVVGLRIAPRSALPVSVVCIDPPLDTRIQFSGDLAGPPVVSPDGTMIAFTAARSGERGRLWVRRLDEREAREIRDTDGALFPFWSPDSRSIGFFRTDALRKVDLESETLFTLCEVTQARGGTWLADGTIVFAPSFRSELFAIDADGGTPRPLAPMDPDLHSSHRWPQALPTPGQFLFIAVNAASRKRANNGVYIGSLDGSPPRRLLDTNYHAQFVDDRLLYVRDRVLLSTRVDLKKATIVGKSQVIARDIQGDLSTWHAQFSASAAGVLVYNQRPEETAAHGSADDRTGYSAGFEGDRISSFARDGRLSNTYAEGEPIVSMRLSPDGSTLVLSTLTRDGTTDLWLYPTGWLPDLSTPEAIDRLKSLVKLLEPKRLTFRKGPESRPIWSPDGTEVAFYWVGDADEGEGAGIYRQRIGDGTSTRIYERDANNGYPAEWTPDGKHVLMVTGGWLTAMDNDIWAIPAEGGDPFPIVETPGFDGAPAVSPDGRWLAYASGSVGNVDVFVIPFPPAWPEGTPSRKWQVSMNGGIAPRWSSDGKELYYITTEGVLVAVETDISGETIAYSAPVALFQSPWDVGASYDVTPRGENDQSRFMFVDLRQPDDEPIAVILGWQRLAE